MSRGLFLQWEGKRQYRQLIPTPRLLEPVIKYSHRSGESGNMLIEGDNLQSLASLKNRYAGQVDVAYIDPPYNLGKDDFRYSDKRFHDPDADDSDAVYVTNEDGGKHTKWLNFMAPRLYLLWQLLHDERGVLFASINDVELFRLGMLLNEIFGEENWIGTIVWRGNTDNNPTRVAIEHEYILCYAKNKTRLPSQWTDPDSEVKTFMLEKFKQLKASGLTPKQLANEYRQFVSDNKDYIKGLVRYKRVDSHGPYMSGRDLHNPRPGGYDYPVYFPGTDKKCRKPATGWRYPEAEMKKLIQAKRIIFGKDEKQVPQLKTYLEEVQFALRSVQDMYSGLGQSDLARLFGANKVFPNAKPVDLIERLLGFATTKESLVMDSFAGSGTTGEAVMKLNKRDKGKRRFILIEEGNGEDKFCRTLTSPRLKKAIEHHEFDEGFTFYKTGQKLDRQAIVNLERDALANLICQADETGRGRGITQLNGHVYIIGKNHRNEAICLVWKGIDQSEVTPEILKAASKEVSQAGLKRPFRIYGTFCRVGDTQSWKFCQIPDEIVAQMHIQDEVRSEEECLV